MEVPFTYYKSMLLTRHLMRSSETVEYDLKKKRSISNFYGARDRDGELPHRL